MKLWILMGACSNDPDVYPGKGVLPGQTVEWQVSDGPSGQRSYSEDYIDPLEVLAIQLEREIGKREQTEFSFGSQQERGAFFKAAMMRLSGVPVSGLDPFPGPDFLSDTDVEIPAWGSDPLSAIIDATVAAGSGADRYLSVVAESLPSRDNPEPPSP